jgi:hypothetical protein
VPVAGAPQNLFVTVFVYLPKKIGGVMRTWRAEYPREWPTPERSVIVAADNEARCEEVRAGMGLTYFRAEVTKFDIQSKTSNPKPRQKLFADARSTTLLFRTSVAARTS